MRIKPACQNGEDGVAKYRQKVVNGLSQAYPHKEYHTNGDVFLKSGVYRFG